MTCRKQVNTYNNDNNNFRIKAMATEDADTTFSRFCSGDAVRDSNALVSYSIHFETQRLTCWKENRYHWYICLFLFMFM